MKLTSQVTQAVQHSHRLISLATTTSPKTLSDGTTMWAVPQNVSLSPDISIGERMWITMNWYKTNDMIVSYNTYENGSEAARDFEVEASLTAKYSKSFVIVLHCVIRR
jgi:hypothetical protein